MLLLGVGKNFLAFRSQKDCLVSSLHQTVICLSLPKSELGSAYTSACLGQSALHVESLSSLPCHYASARDKFTFPFSWRVCSG